MGKPRLIILIRHAQSEGNKNREIHQTIPDHRVKLTSEGRQQALEAGRKLRQLLRPDDTLHFFTSPYQRTRETTDGILSSLTSDDPSPSPFPRHTIKVYEEPRLREQDFGNFQPCSSEMERMWQERADYGHFFYRISNGESAADAYDRVSGFNDSLWRRFEENDFASVCILVTHGLMTRVFLMKWYHFSVEYFEDLRNINHCEFVVMKKNPENGKFILQNQLRTWSEMKRERALKEGGISSTITGLMGLGDSPVPVRRKWGGCPEGCNHAKHNHGISGSGEKRVPLRRNTADLFKDDSELLSKTPPKDSKNTSPVRERFSTPPGIALDGDEDTVLDRNPEKHSRTQKGRFPSSRYPPTLPPHQEVTSPTSATSLMSPFEMSPTKKTQATFLALGGRDGGGSKSGAASLVGSSDDDERSEDEEIDPSDDPPPKRRQAKNNANDLGVAPPRSLAKALHGELGDRGRVMADALGDQSDAEVDETDVEINDKDRENKEMEKIFSEERRDRSLRSSVY